ncbi:hypothetical protein QYM36_010646 [Artemia franciscana]|uniref:BTB domain-containing protein n=2 Tax=Artemia franciscana TaxID=6661 RepID=A0AA88I6E7_ARTSF|nr:hypothetical protein QYM36_010646 [Artemia franciscana]
MEQNEFCLKWTNYANAYKGNFAALLNNEHFTDVTLSCENQNIKCHRLVLSACSSYFENLLISHSDSHPIIILKDIKFCDMQALVKFVYTGEVTVAQAQVKSLLSLADMLKVTGLTESGESSNKAKNTIYLVEGTEVSEASPSVERRRQDRDSENDAFMHDSLMDIVSPIPPCTTGILLNNTNEIRPCSSVAQQNDVITVKSELTSEETAVSVSQFVNSCQDHSEGAGTPSLFVDNAASFNCSNVVKSEVITDPCEETTGPMSNFVYNLQDYGEEAGTSVLSDDNIANFDFPGYIKAECIESTTEEFTDEPSLLEEDFENYDSTNERGSVSGVPDQKKRLKKTTMSEPGKSRRAKTTPRRKSSDRENTSIKIERNKQAARKYRRKQKEYFLQLKNEFEKLGEEIPPYQAKGTKTLEDDEITCLADLKKRKLNKRGAPDQMNLSPAERSNLAAKRYRERKRKYIKQLESILMQKRGFILKEH